MMPQDIYWWIQCSHAEQGPKMLALRLQEIYVWLINKNVHDTCHFMRKPGSKNANRTINKEQQETAIAQENLKLAAFLLYHRW